MTDKLQALYDGLKDTYELGGIDEFRNKMNDETKRRAFYDAVSPDFDLGDYQSFNQKLGYGPGNTVETTAEANREMLGESSMESAVPEPGTSSPFQADSSYLTDEDRQAVADTARMSWKEAKKLGQAAMGVAGQRPTADSSRAAAELIDSNREAASQFEETEKLNQQRKLEAAQPIADAYMEAAQQSKEQAKAFREEDKKLEEQYYDLTKAARDYATSKYGPQPKKLNSQEGWGKAYLEYLQSNDPDKVYEKYNDLCGRNARNNTVSFLEHMANQTERRARMTLKEAEKTGAGRTVMGAGYGITQPHSWSLGMSELWTAENYISLVNKLKDGKQLTDYEQAALDAYGTFQEAASILQEYDTRGFKAGVTTGEMAPFFVQMYLNPARGLGGSLAKKGVQRATFNALRGSQDYAMTAGRKAAEAMREYGTRATRDLLRDYGVDGVKARLPIAMRRLGGDLASATILANTLQVGSTLGSIGEYKYGAPVAGDDGHYTFDPTQEKSWAEAAYKKEMAAIVEGFTEMIGEWQWLGMGEKMAKFGSKKVGQVVSALGDSDFARGFSKLLQDAHWSGVIGETLEEEYGIILNSLLHTGDGTYSEDFKQQISALGDLDQQIDIFLGVGLFGGVVSGANMTAYPIAYVNSKNKLSETITKNQETVQDWDDIQSKIDSADNNGLAAIVKKALYDRDAAKESNAEKAKAEAIINYINALQRYRGLNIARDLLPADADLKTMQAFYLQGYDGADKQAFKAAYEHKKAQLELLDPGVVAILDVEGIDATVRDENGNIVPMFEGDFRVLAQDYLDAKAAYKGMLDGISDRAISKARAAEVVVRGNDNNGKQVEATTRTGDKVHIISGEVVMAGDAANLNQSSKSIVIRHEDGTKEMVSPVFIKSIDNIQDTEEVVKMASERAARESVSQESQEAETPDIESGVQTMADIELGQERGQEQADYQQGDEITLPDGTTGVVNQGIGQTEDGMVEVVWNTPDGRKVGHYTADQLYEMQHPEGTVAAAAQTEQVEATQENTEPTPQQQAYDEWVAKHGDNALNKLNQTRAYAEKELAARQKELNKIQSELNDLPDVENEAITKKKAELEKKQTELQSAIGNYSATLDRMNAIQSVYDAQNQESAAEQKDDAIRNRAAEWEKNTGVKVIILERPEDVSNELARQKIQAGENVKGWFEKGQVYVYLPNNTGAQDFDQTFIHEVIAHKGLKEMLGTQLYAKLCRQVWDQLMTEEQKQEYLALVSHVEGEQAQQLAAADEFIAYFAEKMTLNPTAEDMTTWQQFVKMLTELLNKVFGAKVTEQELSELLIDSLTRYQIQTKAQESKKKPKATPKKKVKKVNKPTDFQNMRKAIEDVIDEMDFETQVRYAASKLGHSIVWGNDPNTGTKGLGSHIVATKGGGLIMHSIDVTPEMKASVMEGQTMFRIGDNEQTHELNAKQKQPGEEVKVAAEAITADIMPFESSPVTREEIAAARDTNLVKQWKRSKNGDLTRMFGSIPAFVRDFAEATLGIDNKYGLDGRVFYHAAEEMDYIMDYAREHGLDAAIADKHNFKDGETIGRLIDEAKPLYTEKELTEIKKVLPEGAIEALNGALQAFADEKRIIEEMERIRALNDGKTMENALTLYVVVYNRLKENYEGDDRYFHTLGRNITDNPRRVINKDISKEILRRIATAPVKANLALEDMSDAVDDIRFRLSNNNRKVVTSWLNKRTDLTEAEKAAVLNDIDNLEDAKTQLATGWWFAKGTIRLPEDMPKVEQAVAVSTIAKVDPLKYSSPMELINAHADIQVKDKPINPDEVNTLHKYRELPDGIVVYDVDDSEESRKNMRAIIDTHFGKESSPWCLLQGDGEGNLTEQSKYYWDYYNSYPKQVAFKDGKLLAFSANNGPRRWWDRMDKSHEGIPVEGKVSGDKLGRSAVMEYDPVDGTATVVGDMWKGNPDNGPFETYYDTGELRSRSTRKNHEDVGLVEKWHKNGQKSAEFTNNELGRTDGPAKTWHANGQLSGQGRFRNGYTEGVWESWYENGQKKQREVYPEDILSVSPENRYNRVGPYEEWYENGNKKQYVPIGEDGRVNGTVTNWFEDGTKESEEVRVDSNTRSFVRWFQSGDLEKKQEWDEDGHKTGTWESYRWDWDSNKSVLQERTTYKNGSKNGPDEEYYPNGNIKIRVNFKDGRAEGLTESWNEDGKPFLRLVRIDGKEIGHEYYDYDKNEVAQLYTMRDGAGVPHNYVRRFPIEGYKPLTEEELSTYPDWAKEEIMADQTMFRVGEEQLGLFTPEDMNGGIAGSQKNINFASNKKSNERGESDIQREGSPGRADSTGRREDGVSQTATSEPAQQSAESVIKPLRKLEEGETCHVERKLSEAGDFSFIGKDKIETVADVAFIFRKLETKAVENAFIAFVKNSKATILHVGMGPIAASLVDLTPITVMMKNINPDKVYFIHNHPSGQLTSSNPDRQLWRAMKSIMGDKLAPGIIIDTTKGKYGMFEGDAGFNDNEEFTENSKGEQQIPVYRFDERVFSKDYDPESSQIRTSRDIAAFVAGHRLGERDKISVLCLDHSSRILGNFFLPYTDFSSNDKIRKIAVDSAYYAGMCGATAIVLYGNGVEPSSTNLPSLAARTLKEFFAHNQLALLDIVGCYRDDTGYYYSYADHGYVAEPGMEYGKQEALKQAEAETDTNPTQGQKEAGNYKKGHVRLFDMDLSIEQPRGSVRSGTDADGKQWSQEMHNTYGYIRGTMGRDKDHIDVFLGDNLGSDKVFVVDQRNIKDSSFDEHKVMLGFDNIDAAREAYESNYEKGWRGMAAITETTLDDFKEWAFADGRRVQPFSSLVKTSEAGSVRKPDAAYAEYDRSRTHGIIAQSVSDDATLEDIGKLLDESNENTPEYGVYNTIYTLASSGLSVREAKDTVINESANATESAAERRMEQDLTPVMEPLTQLAGVSFRISREPSRVRSEYNNGDIVVYNPKSAADVQAAVMRESYTHKDIRNVPGWDALTDAAYRLSEGEIASKAMRGNMDFEAATEEWMYENAERMVAPFEVMMSRNRVNLLYRMTGDEIRMYLTKSDGLLGDAELFTTKEELPVEESIRFRRGSSTPPSSAQQLYDASQQSLSNKFYRAYVDYTKPLRDVQEIIAKESGTPIQDFENAWEAENQRSSKSKNEIEQFELKYFEDIREAVRALEQKTGMTYNEVLNYLIAKHGLERNVVLAQRDAEADYRDYLKEQPGGPMTVKDFFLKRRKRDYSGLTDLSGKQDVADAEDYARVLVSTVESMASKETDALWQTIKDAVEVIQKKRYQSGMISREQMQKEADMFDNYIPLRGFAETIAEDVYDYYEDKMRNRPQYSRRAAGRSSLADDPLATLGAMAASAIMQGNNNLMKQRFLNMVENHKTNIASIKDVWVVNHGTPSAPVWEPEYPDIHEGMDADDIRAEIERYTNRMQQMQRVGLARKATNRLNIKWRTLGQQAKQHIITVRRNGEEQMIIINGNPQVARTVNGINNPDADLSNFMRGVREVQRFMAANFTTRNPAFVVANLCRDLGFAVMAVSAKENAAYRHQFMKNITGPVIKTTKIGKLLRKWQAGTLDVNNEVERYFGEFMDNGGETGYTAENTVDAFRKKMMKGLKDKSKAIKAAEATLEFFELCNRSVEDLTRFTAYMTSRQMGRTVQRSVADAKNITVNFNRKGSGEMLQKYIASGYLFFNAGVQSLQNVAKISGIELSMDEAKGKVRIKIDGKKLGKSAAVLFGSQVMMGMVIPMLNEFMMGLWGGDDDDEAMVDEDGGVISTNPYRRLTEYERRNNLCLWIGGNRFIKIPLAIELRAFYGLGETIYGYMAGIPNPNPGADILNQIADLLPVNFVENSGLVPDAAAPLWQSFITNENFMGIPLYNDSEYLKNEPEANKVYSNTGDAYIALSRWINELGGGDEVSKSKLDGKWNNPAVMQNIVEGYLGGLLTTSRQTANLIGQPIKKFILGKDVEPIPARDWPVVNRLYINTNKRNDDRYVKERYHNYRDQAEKVRHDIRKYEERLDDPKYMEKYQQLLESPEYLDYITFDALNKAVKDAHQDVKEYGDEFKVFETDAMRELVNAMDEDAKAVMQPEQWGRTLSGKDKNISE